MKTALVLHGKTHRVKISVYDWTTEDTPAHLRKERPKFLVVVLPQHHHKSTAFSRGEQLYFDDDPDHAWDIIACYIPALSAKMPRKWRNYFLKWSKRP